jgi:protein-S-isoprenylcysteine O-methyltransferase Ste14
MKQIIESIFQEHIFLPLPFTVWPVPYFVPFWVIYIFNFMQERCLKRVAIDIGKDRKNLDKGSFKVILWLSRVSRIVGYALAFVTPPWSFGNERTFIYIIGLACMICGLLIRRKCFKLLGHSFTGAVTVPSDGEIVKEGFYRLVRHPSYSGGFVFIFGLGLASTNFWSLMVLTIGAVIMFWYRVRVEERILVGSLGDAYIDYMAKTKRFIPYVF